MPDFGIAHLPRRQTDVLFGGINQGTWAGKHANGRDWVYLACLTALPTMSVRSPSPSRMANNTGRGRESDMNSLLLVMVVLITRRADFQRV
jgi:hypothetical protein